MCVPTPNTALQKAGLPRILATDTSKLKLNEIKVVFNAQFHDQNNVYHDILRLINAWPASSAQEIIFS